MRTDKVRRNELCEWRWDMRSMGPQDLGNAQPILSPRLLSHRRKSSFAEKKFPFSPLPTTRKRDPD